MNLIYFFSENLKNSEKSENFRYPEKSEKFRKKIWKIQKKNLKKSEKIWKLQIFRTNLKNSEKSENFRFSEAMWKIQQNTNMGKYDGQACLAIVFSHILFLHPTACQQMQYSKQTYPWKETCHGMRGDVGIETPHKY